MKNKKGFTLIEVVTAVAIVGILSASLVSVVPQLLKSTFYTHNLAEAQIVAKSTLDILQNELRYANYIKIEPTLPNPLQSGNSHISIINGKIISKLAGGGEKSISQSAYGSYTYNLLFSTENPRVLKIDITLFFRNEKIYTLNSRIFIYNLISAGNASITGVSSGSCVSYNVPPIPTGTIVTPTILEPTPTGEISATPVPTATPIPAPVNVSSITVNSNSNSIEVNAQAMQMSADVLPDNAANKGISWSVNDTTLAYIDQSGLLSPLKNGSVIVTATAMDGFGATGTKTIVISNQGIKATSIKIITGTGDDNLLTGGYTLTLTAILTPTNTLNKIVNWTLEDPKGTGATLQEVGPYGCKVKSYNDNDGNTKNDKTGSVFIVATTTDGSNLSFTIEIKIIK